MHKVAKLESRHADRVDDAEATWMGAVRGALERWRTSWQKQTPTPTLNPELSRKFRVCFPLAAHALNHVEAAVALQSSSPWVAMSSVRIAFEHALTAQWVLWTKNGEDLLAQQMALQDHRRSSEFVDVVRISDARMSGTAYGTCVLHVSPESAAGGPLGLVRDGDIIALNARAGTLDLLVPDDELATRQAPPPRHRQRRGYAAMYVDRVLQADRGCDFDFLVGRSEQPENEPDAIFDGWVGGW